MSQVLSGCAVRAAIQELPDVAAGQIWKEVDPRVQRVIQIVSVGKETAFIKTVGSARTTECQLRRFNGKHGGYSFVSHA